MRFLSRITRLLPLVAAAAISLPSAARAQTSTSGTIGASALVVSPLTFTASRDLTIGAVMAGTSKTVAPDDASSGRWYLAGQGTGDVSQTLTLPTTLLSGANAMPISAWSGKVVQGADAAGGTTFSPVSGTAQTFTFPGPSTDNTARLSFRLGATVSPAAAAPKGSYTGTVNIAAAYPNM